MSPINYKIYPPNWKTEIRPRILARAQNRCEQCGIPDRSWVWRNSPQGAKRVQVVLAVCHLDHDPENWQVKDERLRCWCQRCHLAYDSGANRAKVRYGAQYLRYQHNLFQPFLLQPAPGQLKGQLRILFTLPKLKNAM